MGKRLNLHKIGRQALALMLVLVLSVGLLPASVLAADRTITVSGGGTAIQQAINEIAAKEDNTGWTIEIESGTYERFHVSTKIHDLTITAAEGAEVIINVLDGDMSAEHQKELYGGKIEGSSSGTQCCLIRGYDITLSNLTFNYITTQKQWLDAAIAIYTDGAVSVENCVFDGTKTGDGYGIFMNNWTSAVSVTNCRFDTLDQGIYSENTNTWPMAINISNNTFENCSFAAHCSYNARNVVTSNVVDETKKAAYETDGNYFKFCDNEIIGTQTLRNKVVFQDSYDADMCTYFVSGNTFNNGMIGLVNIADTTGSGYQLASDVLEENTFNTSSYMVAATYDYAGGVEEVCVYQADEDACGQWVIQEGTGIENKPFYPLIVEAVEAANEAGSTVLQITGLPDYEAVLYTFTWYKDAIYWETDEEAEALKKLIPLVGIWLNLEEHYSYMIGYSDGLFRPESKITRAEVATIFFRLLSDDARAIYWSKQNDYSDVSADKWYNTAVSTLSHMGLISGYADGTFRPDAPISRAELLKIAVLFGNYNGSAVYTYFTDVAATDWFAPYVTAAVDKGLVNGYSDGSFKPNAYITRAETCAIVNRTLGRHPDKDHMKIPDRIEWPDVNVTDWYYSDVMEATNSHIYQMTGYANATETWNDALPQRDWAAIEAGWEDAYGGHGGEVG